MRAAERPSTWWEWAQVRTADVPQASLSFTLTNREQLCFIHQSTVCVCVCVFTLNRVYFFTQPFVVCIVNLPCRWHQSLFVLYLLGWN